MSVRRAAHSTRNRRPATAGAAPTPDNSQLAICTAGAMRLARTTKRQRQRTPGRSHHRLTSRQSARAPPGACGAIRLPASARARPLAPLRGPSCRLAPASKHPRVLPARSRSAEMRAVLRFPNLRVSFSVPRCPVLLRRRKSKARCRCPSATGLFARGGSVRLRSASLGISPAPHLIVAVDRTAIAQRKGARRMGPGHGARLADWSRRVPAGVRAPTRRDCPFAVDRMRHAVHSPFVTPRARGNARVPKAIAWLTEGRNCRKGKEATFRQSRRLTRRNVFRSGEATASRPRPLSPTPGAGNA
jgi:hypothetical protein